MNHPSKGIEDGSATPRSSVGAVRQSIHLVVAKSASVGSACHVAWRVPSILLLFFVRYVSIFRPRDTLAVDLKKRSNGQKLVTHTCLTLEVRIPAVNTRVENKRACIPAKLSILVLQVASTHNRIPVVADAMFESFQYSATTPAPVRPRPPYCDTQTLSLFNCGKQKKERHRLPKFRVNQSLKSHGISGSEQNPRHEV